MAIGNEIPSMAPRLRRHRSNIVSFAALIGGAGIVLWISHGTQFRQLAIGIMMSAITLSLALALFEVCWHLVVTFFGSENED